MSLMSCPDCFKPNISTSAASCPSCGSNIQLFLKNNLCQRAIAFPIRPLIFWNEWCFYYYWRMTNYPLEAVKPGWIESQKPLLKLNTLYVNSPFTGLVLRDRIYLKQSINIGGGFDCKEFIVIQPLKSNVHEGKPFDTYKIKNSFQPLIEAIWKAEHSDNIFENFFKYIFKQHSKFNKRGHFSSREKLLKSANNLNNIHAIWLPDWDFTSDKCFF